MGQIGNTVKTSIAHNGASLAKVMPRANGLRSQMMGKNMITSLESGSAACPLVRECRDMFDGFS